LFVFGYIQQDELIRQLQEQHFQQYMQQVYQQQLLYQQQNRTVRFINKTEKEIDLNFRIETKYGTTISTVFIS
jgi:hypothetical protein